MRRLTAGAAAILAGVLCSLAFAPVGASYLIFLGIAGLLLVLQTQVVATGSRRFVVLVGLLFGLGFMGPLIWWMNAVSAGAYVALVLLQAVFFAAAAPALRVVLRLRLWPIWAMAVWVAFEYLRSTIPFSGFPWGRLAHPAADTPLASFARLMGIPATSALVFLIAAAIAYVVRNRSLVRCAGVFATIAAVFLTGVLLPIGTAGEAGTKRVALIQGNVPGLFGTWPRGEIFAMHLAQTEVLAEAIASGTEPQPDFVLWPENGTDIDPYDRPLAARQIELASKQVGAPILIGAILNGPTAKTAYNAGVVWDEHGPGDRYVKRELVPYGEYVPFRQALGEIVPRVDRDIPRDMLPGTEPGAIDIAGVTIGDTICWDIAYDEVVRDAVELGAQMLVVQTSNASFTGTSQPAQQWQISRLRAIETGRDVLVPSTNGISGIANAKGETLASAATQVPATLSADITLGNGITSGIRWGGWVQWALIALALVGLGLGLRQREGVS